MDTAMLRNKKMFGLVACLLGVAAVLTFTACEHRGGNNPMPTEPTTTYKISIVSGNNQTGPLDSPLPQPLKVYVTDNIGVKQQGVTVLFAVTEGYGDLSFTYAVTDSSGTTETELTPTKYAGTIKVEAKVRYTDVSVIFGATGVE